VGADATQSENTKGSKTLSSIRLPHAMGACCQNDGSARQFNQQISLTPPRARHTGISYFRKTPSQGSRLCQVVMFRRTNVLETAISPTATNEILKVLLERNLDESHERYK